MNLNKWLLLFFILIINNCALTKKQPVFNINQIYKSVQYDIKKLYTPVKVVIKQNDKTNTLYGKLNIENKNINLNLYSMLNYYNVKFEYTNQKKYVFTLNKKKYNIKFIDKIKNDFYDIMVFLLFNKISDYKKIRLLQENKTLKFKFHNFINGKIFINENKNVEINSNLFRIVYKKQVLINNKFIPVIIDIYNKETGDVYTVYLSKNKLYIE
jgi:hypothetical protein